MRCFKFAPLLALGAALLVPGSSWMPHSSPLQASLGGLKPLVDSDGDGLDDGLEFLYGTETFTSDTDNDGVDDLLEMLLDRNPNEADLLSTAPSEPKLHYDLYTLDNLVIAQIAVLYRKSVGPASFVWSDKHQRRNLTFSQMRPTVVDAKLRPTGHGQWKVQTVRLKLPKSWFDRVENIFLGLQVNLDGKIIGEQLFLGHMNGHLTKFRPHDSPLDSQGPQQGPPGTQTGGIFPVEPSEEPPIESAIDSVCVQVIVPIARFPDGTVLYRVDKADCEAMPRAICYADCSASVGDTFVGLDIIGLLE